MDGADDKGHPEWTAGALPGRMIATNTETPDMWPLRSMLFIPAHKLDWVRSVERFKPDAVVIDLEDSVPPAMKAAARGMAREGIGLLQARGIPAVVRINEWDKVGHGDVLAVAAQ